MTNTCGEGGAGRPINPIGYRYRMIALYRSPEYQELTAYYARKSSFSILGIARREIQHSNMIAWLLDSKGGHGLGKNPMRWFLQLLATAKLKYPVNRDSHLPDGLLDTFITGNFDIGDTRVEKEVAAGGGKGRIDLLLAIGLAIGKEKKELPIIIENKVGSEEHTIGGKEQQTLAYHAWATGKYADREKYFPPLFVFLTPDGSYGLETGNGDLKPCECRDYIRINYQGFADHVIAPCLNEDMSDEVRHFLKDYIRCLSFETLTPDERKNKMNMIMALGPREKELLHAFWEKNEDLLLAAICALSEDASIELDDTVRMKMRQVAEGIQQRDKTKYQIGGSGEPLGKGRMVLAVVKQYVQCHEGIAFAQLREAFPDTLVGSSSYGVVREMTPDIQRQTPPRYFVNDSIKLADGTVAVVCSQWGIGNIQGFITHARQQGCDIREV